MAAGAGAALRITGAAVALLACTALADAGAGPPDGSTDPRALLEELKTTSDRHRVLSDLRRSYNDRAEVTALWRTLVFDDGAELGERTTALRALEPHLTDDDLVRLGAILSGPTNRLSLDALGVVVRRHHTATLPKLLEVLARADLEVSQRDHLLSAALRLSDCREDIVALALASPTAWTQATALTQLAAISSARARPFALARLGHSDWRVRAGAESSLLDPSGKRDPVQRAAAYPELVALARDPKSEVAKSESLRLALGTLAFDRNLLDDAVFLFGREPATASSLAHLAYVEAVRGNAGACVEAAKKLAKLPKTAHGCTIGVRPAASFESECRWNPRDDLIQNLTQVCGGPLKAAFAFERRAGVIDLAGTVENTTASDVETAGARVEIQWSHKGEPLEQTPCAVATLALPKKTQALVRCERPRLPGPEGTSDWPVRADITITVNVVSKDPKAKPLVMRTSAYLVR